MTRDADGEWGTVVYDADEPRNANFHRAASQSSVFNPVTGEFDGSSSVSGDSEVTITGHEIDERPAEKNRFEINLETIFVDAGSSLAPPDDAEDVLSEDDDTQYPFNPAPPGSVWGAAASGFVSGFFSRKNASTAIGLIPVVGTVQSAVELATGRDFIAGEEADRRAAMVGLVPGGKGVVNGAKGIIKAAAPLARQTTILGSAAGAANALRKNVPKKARNTTPSPALEGSPYYPDVVRDRVRPPYRTNPSHQPGVNLNPTKGIEPPDASDVYDSAVRAGMGKWYGIGADGRIYQFFSDNAGHVHFSGYVSRHSVPKIIREQLGL